jgi:hypothetical protein
MFGRDLELPSDGYQDDDAGWMADDPFLEEVAAYLSDNDLADKLMLGKRRADGLLEAGTVEYNYSGTFFFSF